MAGAELKIVFVGEDADQQAAFSRNYERDRQASALAGQHSQPQADPKMPASFEALARRLEELAAVDRGSQATAQPAAEPRSQTFAGRVMERIRASRTGSAIARGVARVRNSRVVRAAASLGRRAAGTRAGRAVIGAARGVGARVAQTRVGQAVGGMLARGAAAGAAGGAAGAAGGAAAGAGAGAAAALGPVGVAAAGAAVALTAAAVTVKLFSDAMNKAADSLEDLSPEIARVRGLQSARMELARLGRAQATGAGLAQLDAARGRLEESSYVIQTRILEVLLKFAPIVEAILDAVNLGVRGADDLLAQAQVAIEAVKDMFGDANPQNNVDAQRRADETAKALKAALQELFNRGDHDPSIDNFFHSVLFGIQQPGPQRNFPPNIGQFP